FFFFSSRRRHTRFSRDWSSDVCSSDLRFATDGIALIANGSSIDSVVHVDDIIKKLQGEESSLGTLVFDNPNSSTVRYLQELAGRSEERRVGKECRSRGSPNTCNEKSSS